MGSNLVSSHENLLLGNLPLGEFKLFSISAKSLLDSVCSPSGSNNIYLTPDQADGECQFKAREDAVVKDLAKEKSHKDDCLELA
jgi:hypothetical protein